jgi:hypothetical protein
MRRGAVRSTLVAVVSAALVAAGSGCGGDDEESPRPAEAPGDVTGTRSEEDAGSPDREEPPRADPNAPVVEAARDYVEALNERDGRRLCSLLAPGALREVELPHRRSSCAASVSASVGYADPRGFPQWRGTRIERIGSVSRDGARGRVTLTVFHRFADRKTLSSEEDVVHVLRRGERWLVAKPSATFYRAIGAPDVPPSALAAP